MTSFLPNTASLTKRANSHRCPYKAVRQATWWPGWPVQLLCLCPNYHDQFDRLASLSYWATGPRGSHTQNKKTQQCERVSSTVQAL